MAEEHKHTYTCQNCGNEADLIIKEEDSIFAEEKHEQKPNKGTLVCKVCGNEADTIFEEI